MSITLIIGCILFIIWPIVFSSLKKKQPSIFKITSFSTIAINAVLMVVCVRLIDDGLLAANLNKGSFSHELVYFTLFVFFFLYFGVIQKLLNGGTKHQ